MLTNIAKNILPFIEKVITSDSLTPGMLCFNIILTYKSLTATGFSIYGKLI